MIFSHSVSESSATVKKNKLEILMHLHTFNTPEHKNVGGVQYDVFVP